MIYSLKDKNRNEIVSINVSIIHGKFIYLKTFINIESYSYFLLKNESDQRKKIITIFNGIQNLSNTIFEDFIKDKEKIEHKEILKNIEEFITIISEEFNFILIKEL